MMNWPSFDAFLRDALNTSIESRQALVDGLLDGYFRPRGIQMRGCHPRDLHSQPTSISHSYDRVRADRVSPGDQRDPDIHPASLPDRDEARCADRHSTAFSNGNACSRSNPCT